MSVAGADLCCTHHGCVRNCESISGFNFPRELCAAFAGELHPRARKYRMGAAMLRQRMQIVDLRNYHNALVVKLLAVAAAQRPHVPSEADAAQTA